MLGERTSRGSENTEEGRAFLQARIALYWKVLFFLMAIASALGAFGPMAKGRPGPDLLIDIALAALAGLLWRVCARGHRSVKFLRTIEGIGLLIYFCGSALLGRYVLVGFAREHALATDEGTVMADAYLAAMGVTGTALMVLIRAAVIPSSPRRTLLSTAMVGAPIVLGPTFLIPTESGGLALRVLDARTIPWLPLSLVMLWSFVLMASTVISRVIYGLRKEVREARRLGQYVVEEKIGEGGMGEVYRARHGMMRRPTRSSCCAPTKPRARPTSHASNAKCS